MSRIWGATLDHIDEVEVITANGQVVRANTRNNSDLFFVSLPALSGLPA
jgi:FAD/FMN-containing dehydrogenase